MNSAEEQTVAMALAHLAVERPGWLDHCREIAEINLANGANLFDGFHHLRKLNLDSEAPRPSEVEG